ncbi:MAG: hypothetical protein VB082_04175 [Christensenella sp.]|nr:hypothetical protein [Christensenella sp.]
MKKVLIMMMAALLVMAMAACSTAPSASESASSAAPSASESAAAATSAPSAEESTQIANPWTDAADAKEAESMVGYAMSALPKDATDVQYSVMKESKVSQARFMWNGDEYLFRMAPEPFDDDLSGMYVTFKNEEDLKIGDFSYEIDYNEGAEGKSEWDTENPEMEYSVTMSTGATRDKLIAITEVLSPVG